MSVTSPVASAAAVSQEQLALEAALRQTKDVKQKVEIVATDLGTTNAEMKKRIAAGSRTMPAHTALKDGERVQSTVEEVADDLRGVDAALSEGVDHLNDTERALADTQSALAKAGDELETSRNETEVIRQRALHDPMTGLPNRELFDDRVTQAIALAQRRDWTLAVFFVDLDGFKKINDDHGHAHGDRALKEIAGRLLQHLREEDSVCRNGGDEFLLLLLDPQGRENIERIARTLIERIAQPILLDSTVVTVGASLGISFFPDHGGTGDQLIAQADAAMYRAKRRGGGYAS